ncbi:adenosylcobinamide kinase/adenosylcobinamide-phosphate guanylyltransferase [Ereboglobus sp. PH5-5]|uniref:bifunctional adenosylcobinamide kinase/adenosylcobinamide-phosphate guanylyltransferase n=1 Tax=unclassified Ereboglobus TaxID=2626932 RepID=UPI002405FCD4|nr:MULTISPECIES: bifunctional adenosylcobinamide kinase/adenosylcobinamide-phosphate guanylyltransferase [unclassified Ereboglobus]MDF9827181.1 adenosylcobinamide kinase/adenosylcobinamide-phosphate guanylyltransferase [Ereboglobus sp. PH5-10]MDF9832601.1 adenosylcobinamide kinase/adenosylcobinamide-phosphate guanylyltransferase [Ereboglobus sp. PH5-5]
MAKITFFTGPVRSGKSRRAVALATGWGMGTVFVATCRPPVRGADGAPLDSEMAERIRRHRDDRPAWRVLEAPQDIAAALDALAPPPAGVVLDCLTLWVSDRLDREDGEIIADWEKLLSHFREAAYPVVIVSNEIGWAPVPAQPIMRRFRDLIGTLGQLTAEAADEAYLCAVGQALRLK